MIKKFKNIKKPFLIAEVGINHNGKIDNAIKLIDLAKTSGADAIKFQTYKTEKRVRKDSPIYKILKNCELSYYDFEKIKKYCDKKKIIFFSTPFDLEAVDFLEELKVPFYKIASFDLSNYELINKIILTKKPTIISTGMGSLSEIKKTYTLFKRKKIDLSLLHCISSYPNKDTSSYLSNIRYLKSKFNCTIGFSDHTNDIKTSIYSALLGAQIIEKHFTISKDFNCVDRSVSIYPELFNQLRKELDLIPLILSKPHFGVRKEEKQSIIFKRKKIIK